MSVPPSPNAWFAVVGLPVPMMIVAAVAIAVPPIVLTDDPGAKTMVLATAAGLPLATAVKEPLLNAPAEPPVDCAPETVIVPCVPNAASLMFPPEPLSVPVGVVLMVPTVSAPLEPEAVGVTVIDVPAVFMNQLAPLAIETVNCDAAAVLTLRASRVPLRVTSFAPTMAMLPAVPVVVETEEIFDARLKAAPVPEAISIEPEFEPDPLAPMAPETVSAPFPTATVFAPAINVTPPPAPVPVDLFASTEPTVRLPPAIAVMAAPLVDRFCSAIPGDVDSIAWVSPTVKLTPPGFVMFRLLLAA